MEGRDKNARVALYNCRIKYSHHNFVHCKHVLSPFKKTKSELKRQCKAIDNYHIGLKYFACYKLTSTGF